MTASTASVDGGEAPQLFVSEGLVVDDLVHERMARHLMRAPADLQGIVAETGVLPPGSSYRVHAEWRALEFSRDALQPSTNPTRGAALVRHGVTPVVRGDAIHVDGSLLLDRGAYVHDPWQVAGALEVATEFGRPPFPRRPVVAFVGIESDDERAEWARQLVNALLPLDIEGRLALPEVPTGMHLSRPCLPCAESIRALAPDAIVALDATAAAEVAGWVGTDRSTVVIGFAPDSARAAELVSWRIGEASGRLRARIGWDVDSASLARLVLRLCAGPHPMPPTRVGTAALSTTAPIGAPRRADIASSARPVMAVACVVLTESLDADASTRVAGLVDHLSAAGVSVAAGPLRSKLLARARTADLVLLVGNLDGDTIHDLIRTRMHNDKATVVDLQPYDLTPESGIASNPLALTARAAELARTCGLASSPGGAVDHAIRALGVRAHVLPTLLTHARAAALRQALAERASERAWNRAIGWHVGSAATPAPTYLDAVAAGLSNVLTARPEVHVQVVGDPTRVPSMLRGHERVTTSSGGPSPATVARWSAHLWTPKIVGGEPAADTRPYVEAAHAGVPSVLAAAARAAIDGYVAPQLVVADVDASKEWMSAVSRLLDHERERAARSLEASRRSHALDGPVASQAIVTRFLGWASYKVTS